MPLRDLVSASESYWSEDVKKIAKNLAYRDFITVGLLYDQIDFAAPLTDNWIYIQDSGVNVGRIQIFNNWSPHMVSDPSKIWLGLEFFCKESDKLWKMSNKKLIALAEKELFLLALVKTRYSIDSVVLKVPKAYPGYFGLAYKKFHILQNELDKIKNLFLIGRNGMHRYNNQDHSMLTAKEAVEQIVSGCIDKAKIWRINVDDSYHEEK